ncbi:MAG TPA: hypothetical protein VH023_07815 [Rhodopila sp.]|jgi:hypothetical protein|nr:hypothetical protein [Rhodopila sp.]
MIASERHRGIIVSEESAGFGSDGTVWAKVPPPVRHSYGLTVRDHGLGTAIGLLIRSLPYALARFGILLAYSVACIIWIVVTFGGAAWLGSHIAGAFGLVWFVMCVVGIGWFWGTVLRYALHLLACGHVAVLTELITRGQVGNGTESMLSYGKRIVIQRFGEVNILFGLNMLVRGILNSFHRTLDWIDQLIPIPGLESLSNLVSIILRAATRYLDKVLLSYNLARNDGDPWTGAREGLVYYAQNAKPILITAVWIVIQERVLTFVLWLLLLAPAGLITVMLPASVRQSGGVVTVLIAILLAGTLRSAFIKPLFLIMMMVRFHALTENQPINQDWDNRLAGLSDKFRTLGAGFTMPQGSRGFWPGRG